MKKFSPHIIWTALGIAIILSIFRGEWSTTFISVLTLLLTAAPYIVTRLYKIYVPQGFLFAIVFFIYATLFLGEVADFYERFWWWDAALHTGSAIGFGIIGFVVLLMLFRSEKVNASPLLISIFAFSFALAIGALWEIFEFTMDQLFGLNMQKSGIVDTMWDFIVDAIGAFVASLAGYLYLTKNKTKGLSGVIHDTVTKNLGNSISKG